MEIIFLTVFKFTVVQAALGPEMYVYPLDELCSHRATLACTLPEGHGSNDGYRLRATPHGSLIVSGIHADGDFSADVMSIKREGYHVQKKDFLFETSEFKSDHDFFEGETINFVATKGDFKSIVFSATTSLEIKGDSLSFGYTFFEVIPGQTVVKLLPEAPAPFHLELVPVYPIVWVEGAIRFNEPTMNLKIVGAHVNVVVGA